MERRLDKIAKALGAGETPRGAIAFVDLPSWPELAREAFLRADAAGDTATTDRLVFEQTGVTPSRGGGYINTIVTMPAGTVGEDLVVVAPRYRTKETRR